MRSGKSLAGLALAAELGSGRTLVGRGWYPMATKIRRFLEDLAILLFYILVMLMFVKWADRLMSMWR